MIDWLKLLQPGDIIRIRVYHDVCTASAVWFSNPEYSYSSEIRLIDGEYRLDISRCFGKSGPYAMPFARCSTAQDGQAEHYVIARVTRGA